MEAMPSNYNNPQFVKQLIQAYKQNPCLWKMKSPDYTNKQMKSDAYQELINLTKTIDDDASIHTVKRKINSLRRAFRKELTKVEASKGKSWNGEATYVPKLWYYEMMQFTKDVESDDSNDEEADDVKGEVECDMVNLPITTVFEPDESFKPKRQKRNYMEPPTHSIHNSFYPTDEFDAYAITVAAKLRKMDLQQRIFCEHIINTTLYYAALNKLNEASTIELKFNLSKPKSPEKSTTDDK